MKKYTFILAATLAFVACSKEEVGVNEPNDVPAEGNVHELFVALPSISDADTKASINVTNGKFSWDAGDEIAVTTSTSKVYKFVAAADGADGEAVRFTYTGEMNGTPATIKYPFKADGTSTDLPTEIASLTGALDAANIRLTGTVSENSATLSYENAFLKVTFTNVPTFAKSIFFDGTANDVTISGISLAAKGDVVAYIPVSASNTGFTVSIRDKNSNIITAKATTSAKSFTNGSIKNMKSVPVGKVITINDAASKGWGELAIWKSSDSSKNYRFKTGNAYPSKLNSLDGVYYAVINTHESGFAWAVEGVDLAVSYEEYEGGSGCSTPCVYLYRDFSFTTPSTGNHLICEYRIYPSCQYNTYSDPCIYIYDSGDNHLAGDWPGTHLTKKMSTDSSVYYEFESSYSNASDITIIFSNNGGNQMSNWTPTINRDYTYQYW